MDQELIEYLDRRFTGLKNELRTELRADLRIDIAASAADLRAEIVASAEETRRYVDASVAASAEETRRHFGVVAESLMSKIQLVAEGVVLVNQKVDRLAAQMRDQFEQVDRRFLHLHAQILGLR